MLCSKGVDINNPIQPTQLPRGYSDVAVLWNKNIDCYVKPLADGNERLQCIEFGQPSGKNYSSSQHTSQQAVVKTVKWNFRT